MNHPYLVIYSPTSSSAAEHAQKALDAKAAAGLCPLCHDPFEVGAVHPPCVWKLLTSACSHTCPLQGQHFEISCGRSQGLHVRIMGNYS